MPNYPPGHRSGSTLGMLGGPLGGWLADRYGRPRVLAPAMCGAAAATGGLIIAPTWPGFVCTFCVWATSLSVLMPTLQAHAVDITASHHVGQAQGLHRQCSDVVFLTSPIALGMLADLQGGTYTGSIAVTASGMMFALYLYRSRI